MRFSVLRLQHGRLAVGSYSVPECPPPLPGTRYRAPGGRQAEGEGGHRHKGLRSVRSEKELRESGREDHKGGGEVVGRREPYTSL